MTIGRTDDLENPSGATAFEAASLFGAGSRIPSGPAAMLPRQQAGHMIATDPVVRFLDFSLASKGPSTHAPAKAGADHDDGLATRPVHEPILARMREDPPGLNRRESRSSLQVVAITGGCEMCDS